MQIKENRDCRITKSEYIYNQIYTDIINSKLPPESKLRVRDVADKFDVSEIPVREAFQKLESEGLLNYIPYVGYEVPPFSVNRVRWTYEIKNGLEALACRLAIKHNTPQNVQALRDILNEGGGIDVEKNPRGYEEHNRRFHMTMYSFSYNDLLCSEIEKYWRQNTKIRSSFNFSHEYVKRSSTEHELMLESFAAGDEDELVRLVVMQRERTWKNFVESYNSVAQLTGAPLMEV